MTATQNDTGCPRVVLELRPAFEGFAGIPQETRLLFRGLRMLKSMNTSGMLQMSLRVLSKGTAQQRGGIFGKGRELSEPRRINRYSRVVISASEQPFGSVSARLVAYFERRQLSTVLSFRSLIGRSSVKLTVFRAKYFEDFIWRTLFSNTLPASDFSLVTESDQLICSVPWHSMHMVGLNTNLVFGEARYARLDTKGIDIFISQTPYPAVLHRSTALVVRYHDALPLLMPHTIPDKSLHQATHYHALTSNVKSGAYFACVSEATRRDLLKIYPKIGERAVTIHNMVSHHYFQEEAAPDRIPGIIRSRLYAFDPDAKKRGLEPKFLSIAEQERFYKKALAKTPIKYLLAVSTIEPRKNHLRLLAAWESLKTEHDQDLKLVVVGTLGWNYDDIIKGFKTWIERGELFLLNKVPSPDLRVLYRNAAATVCPSLGEGFDFSGVESMRSGGVVIASDIAVHREIYDGAADYFDPYSTTSLVGALTRTLYAADADEVQVRLRALGREVAARYEPEKILPQWDRFLARVLQERRSKLPSSVLDTSKTAEERA